MSAQGETLLKKGPKRKYLEASLFDIEEEKIKLQRQIQALKVFTANQNNLFKNSSLALSVEVENEARAQTEKGIEQFIKSQEQTLQKFEQEINSCNQRSNNQELTNHAKNLRDNLIDRIEKTYDVLKFCEDIKIQSNPDIGNHLLQAGLDILLDISGWKSNNYDDFYKFCKINEENMLSSLITNSNQPLNVEECVDFDVQNFDENFADHKESQAKHVQNFFGISTLSLDSLFETLKKVKGELSDDYLNTLNLSFTTQQIKSSFLGSVNLGNLKNKLVQEVQEKVKQRMEEKSHDVLQKFCQKQAEYQQLSEDYISVLNNSGLNEFQDIQTIGSREEFLKILKHANQIISKVLSTLELINKLEIDARDFKTTFGEEINSFIKEIIQTISKDFPHSAQNVSLFDPKKIISTEKITNSLNICISSLAQDFNQHFLASFEHPETKLKLTFVQVSQLVQDGKLTEEVQNQLKSLSKEPLPYYIGHIGSNDWELLQVIDYFTPQYRLITSQQIDIQESNVNHAKAEVPQEFKTKLEQAIKQSETLFNLVSRLSFSQMSFALSLFYLDNESDSSNSLALNESLFEKYLKFVPVEKTRKIPQEPPKEEPKVDAPQIHSEETKIEESQIQQVQENISIESTKGESETQEHNVQVEQNQAKPEDMSSNEPVKETVIEEAKAEPENKPEESQEPSKDEQSTEPGSIQEEPEEGGDDKDEEKDTKKKKKKKKNKK